jgi:hypothetical protein
MSGTAYMVGRKALPIRNVSERRQLTRKTAKQRASLIIDHGRQAERIPCVILDSSQDGFKIGGASCLKRGEPVELIPDEHASNTVPCRVRWVGRPGSQHGGEAGLRVQCR